MRPGDTLEIRSNTGRGEMVDVITFEWMDDTHIHGKSTRGVLVGLPLIYVTKISRTHSDHIEGCSYGGCFQGSLCRKGTV